MMHLLRYFERPWLLLLVVLLPLAAALLVRHTARRRRERLERLAAPGLLPRLGVTVTESDPRWRAARLALAAALCAVALAGPRWGAETALVRGEGIDLVLALDASLSMLAEDERPSRMERMKQEVRRLRALSPNDRIALLAFAGRSYILTPLTVDDGAIELFLDNLDPSVVGQAGSSVSRTIRQGTELLTAANAPGGRALVVMSDGEAFEDRSEVIEAARRAQSAGVTLVTVGFGSLAGATIPVREGNMTVEKRDADGRVVVTRYDPDLLQAAAEAAAGVFIPAEATDKAGRTRDALSQLRRTQRRVEENRSLTQRFQLFLLPAVLLLILDTWRSERRRAAGGTRARSSWRGRGFSGTGRRSIATGTAAALLLSTIPAPLRADVVDDAGRHYRAGRYLDAIALYRRALERGDRRPQVVYNLGTALLGADSLAAAAEVFEQLRGTMDGDVRYRAMFNLGLAHLQAGLADQGPGRDQALDAALDAYKQVLLQRPDDVDAKWNYELALREKEESSGGGGGGGGGGGDQQDQDGQGGDGGADQSPGSLGQQQAEQILNSAAREERAVQGKRQRQTAPEPPRTGRDW